MILALKSAAFAVAVAAMSSAPAIFVNQVAYDLRGPKLALIQTDAAPHSGWFLVAVSAMAQPPLMNRRGLGER